MRSKTGISKTKNKINVLITSVPQAVLEVAIIQSERLPQSEATIQPNLNTYSKVKNKFLFIGLMHELLM